MDSKRDSKYTEFGPSSSTTSFEHSGLIDGYDVRSTKERSSRYSRTIFTLAITNAICAALLLMAVVALRSSSTECIDPKVTRYGDKPKWFPPEKAITTILEADASYTREPDEEELKAWDHLMPMGRGLVMVNNQTALPEMPNLDQALPRGATAWIGIAHQLHCLYSTKHAFYDLYYNQGKPEAEKKKLFGTSWNLEHLNHCWDYIRQGLVCNADVTLEWRGAVEGTGWGYERQCKDWNAIYHWIENHRITNDVGILRDNTKSHPLDTSKIPGVWGSLYGPNSPPP